MNTITDTICIKRLGINDIGYFRELISLFSEVFEDNSYLVAGEDYLVRLLTRPDFIVYAAIYEEIRGGLTAFELPRYYSEESEVFIYDVAIKPAFQRGGIGKKLLSALKEYCLEKGIKEIFVPANKEDVHAIDFYLSCGGEAEEVVHFNFSV